MEGVEMGGTQLCMSSAEGDINIKLVYRTNITCISTCAEDIELAIIAYL